MQTSAKRKSLQRREDSVGQLFGILWLGFCHSLAPSGECCSKVPNSLYCLRTVGRGFRNIWPEAGQSVFWTREASAIGVPPVPLLGNSRHRKTLKVWSLPQDRLLIRKHDRPYLRNGG